MRHAFSTLGCSELSLAKVCDLAKRYSVAGVELRGLGGTLDLPDYLAVTFGAPAAFAEALLPTQVTIVSLNTGYPLVGGDAHDRAEFLRYVPWAEAAGVPWLRVFDGKVDASGNYLDDLAASIEWWDVLRREQGWRTHLMVETHDGLLTREALAQALKRAPTLRLLWDAHNTWRQSGEAPSHVWPAIRDRVVHVHVKDSVARPSATHPYTYTLPGRGEFPMAKLRQSLSQHRYDGFLSLEWERKWHPYLPPLEQALACADRGWW